MNKPNLYKESLDLFIDDNERSFLSDDIWGVINDPELEKEFDGKSPLDLMDEMTLGYPIMKQAIQYLNELYHRDWDKEQLGMRQTTKQYQTYDEFCDIMEHLNVFMIEAKENK